MLKIYLIENVRGMQPGLEPATSDSAVDKTSEITFKKPTCTSLDIVRESQRTRGPTDSRCRFLQLELWGHQLLSPLC